MNRFDYLSTVFLVFIYNDLLKVRNWKWWCFQHLLIINFWIFSFFWFQILFLIISFWDSKLF